MTRPLLALIALAVLLAVLRLHYLDWPPNRDVTTYSVIARELLEGEQLYADVWDHKPPAVFVTFGLAQAALGYGPVTLYALNLIAGLAVLFAVFWAGTASGMGTGAGLWAAAFWVALSGDLSLQMHDPNAEAFMNVCAVWGFVLLLGSASGSSRQRAALAGLLFAAATMYKQVMVTVPLALGLAHIASPPPGVERRSAVGDVLVIAAIGAGGWLSFFLVMALSGHLGDVLDVLFYSASYAADRASVVEKIGPTGLLSEMWDRFGVVLPLVLLGGVGMLAGLGRGRRGWILLAAYSLGAAAAIALPGRYYRHYFQLGLPPLVIACGWATVTLRARSSGLSRRLPQLGAAAALLYVSVFQVRYYRASAEEMLPRTYAEIYLATQQLGRELDSLLLAGETLYQWGSETGLYFFADRRPPSAILAWPLIRGPLATGLTSKALQELQEQPPSIVVVAHYVADSEPQHPVLEWTYANYRPVPALPETLTRHFALFVRRGSPLDTRVNANAWSRIREGARGG